MSIVLVGSTSGSVTLQEPAVAGTTVLTLPAVSGTVLTDTSPKAGNVIQVVSATSSTEYTTTSSSFTDTGLTINITPTSSSSKILVSLFINGVFLNNVNAGFGRFQLVRNSTGLGAFGYAVAYLDSTAGGASNRGCSTVAFQYLDSPATTSSTTYKVQFAQSTGSTLNMNRDNSGVSSITVMEIAA